MEDITKKYKKYKLNPSNESMKELCQPSKFNCKKRNYSRTSSRKM
jgi:hypothetical protein